ncbi:hypothetical protein EXIGLDRAFT_768811 [Exidia glandulosa HHB12029]|uniref:Uncharacterized protein n=1 Tax=Exidia glandulosa HHB12029 TaxID=1314781 RepID=A0A165HXD6_EXIGL|nr:hypothetical protein EXIGLDRAFT_768811 [Exidia glandulosa HHB12029]
MPQGHSRWPAEQRQEGCGNTAEDVTPDNAPPPTLTASGRAFDPPGQVLPAAALQCSKGVSTMPAASKAVVDSDGLFGANNESASDVDAPNGQPKVTTAIPSLKKVVVPMTPRKRGPTAFVFCIRDVDDSLKQPDVVLAPAHSVQVESTAVWADPAHKHPTGPQLLYRVALAIQCHGQCACCC